MLRRNKPNKSKSIPKNIHENVQQLKEDYEKIKNKDKNHPYIIYKNAMKEEAKREKREEKKKQKDEKRNNCNKGERHGGYDGVPALILMKQSSCEMLMKPKEAKTAYDFYTQYANTNSDYEYLSPQQLKQKWKKMSGEEKVKYINLAFDDNRRFEYEMKVYRESLKQEGCQDDMDEVKPQKVKKFLRLKRNTSQ